MSDLEGVVLSDYLLVECVSKGGVADVYRARPYVLSEQATDEQENTYEVAVKVFRPGYAQRESFRDYFMIEAEKIGQFEHPNILPFLEYGEGDGLLYLVTPYVPTGTLENLLQRVGGRFSALQALPIMQQLCSAVQYAHDHDVIHGNIKPSNVFIAGDGRMLLSDFGITRSYDDSQHSLTRIGWGSAEYASPEQSLGVVRRASDIYSLGVLLYRVLTGSPPFAGQTPVEVLLKHVRQELPSARSLVPNISDAVDDVLRKALQKRSDDRFASAQELSNAFLQAVTVAPIASPVARVVAPAPTTRKLPSIEDQLTPLPATNTRALPNDPQTPIPAYLAFGSSATSIPVAPHNSVVLPANDEVVEQLDFPQMSPILPPNSASFHDTDRTEVRKKNFLLEDKDDDDTTVKSIFWSADPAEWSPVAKNAEEAAPLAVPLTAEHYLKSKPSVPEKGDSPALAENVQEPKASKSSGTWLKKWLPVVVVILLLLGLLGAVFSAFFFPTDNKSSVTTHQPTTAVNSGANTTTTATASLSITATATPTHTQMTPTATAVATKPPTPTPIPIPTEAPIPPFACTNGSITLDGSPEFNPAVQQATSDYAAQCPSNTATITVNANGSTSALNATANGTTTLAYADLASAARPTLVNYNVAALTYAVVVSSDTNVTQLSTAQLQAIYTGKITNWSQVGGVDEPIVIVSRSSGSAIRTVFETYVLRGVKQSIDGLVVWTDTSDLVMKKVLSTAGAISYVPVNAVPSFGAQSVAINGVAPGTTSVANGSYAFWDVIHFYSNHAATGLALSFISFFSTPTGQSDLAAFGAVSIKSMSPAALSSHLVNPQG